MGIEDIAKAMVKSVPLPEDTALLLSILRSMDIHKFRKFMKKHRQEMPSKYKRLYLKEDYHLEVAMHYLRTQLVMYFSEAERKISRKFIVLKQAQMDGQDIMERRVF